MRQLLNNKEIFYFALLAFGIQLANSLQMTNIGSVYQFMSAPSKYLTFLGLAAPISGLIIQPIIGQFSDNTLSEYGKRRPYLFVWTLVGAICCILLPFSFHFIIAAFFMCLLSCSLNGATESLRALTGDKVNNSQKAKAFSWQTVLSGIGAAGATGLSYLLSLQKFDFHLGKLPFSLSVGFISGGIIWLLISLLLLPKIKERRVTRYQQLQQARKQAHISKYRLIKNTLIKLWKNLFKMPTLLKQFCVIQIFTWMGLYTMLFFFSIAVSQHLFQLPFHATPENQKFYAKVLEKGTLKANMFSSIYQFVSVIYALFLPYLSEKISPKFLHGLSIITGGIGLVIFCITSNTIVLILCMVAVGILWGSIMTLPYSIISAIIPSNKMGIFLGIFNVSVTLPQIIAGIMLQPIYTLIFHYNAVYIIILSGLLIIAGGVLTIYQDQRSTKSAIENEHFQILINNFMKKYLY